jgi:PhnB protein
MEIETIVPYLSVVNAEKAVSFYSQIFDVEPTLLLKMPDGTVMHCEFQFGGVRLFLSEELIAHGGTPSPANLGGTSVAIHLYVSDCDSMVERMTSAGAELLMEPMDMFWGERFARLRDPFGHEWGISTRQVSMSSSEIQEEVQKLFKQKSN